MAERGFAELSQLTVSPLVCGRLVIERAAGCLLIIKFNHRVKLLLNSLPQRMQLSRPVAIFGYLSWVIEQRCNR